ncbi:hypothetical protein L3X38_033153 [Prunus dulcis]|uniref:Uncharacterized protein n=1 Tax=Prunus dulcis TaxID=3755 RepID=A0AAD4VFE9_PRUDU|nr:hypothetical protein L3X38_033153 [Prunus dulcis]
MTAIKTVMLPSEKNMSWQDWENSFIAFKVFFDGGAKILQSIDVLLPLCHKFDGYASFPGAFVYPVTVGVLKKFMDRYGNFMEIAGITSSFSRSIAFRALGFVLHGMNTLQLLDITNHRLLCRRDAICEAIDLGFHIDFYLTLVRSVAHAVFRARAIHSMKSSLGSYEVKAATDAFNLKQRELEDRRRELQTRLRLKVFLPTVLNVWRKQQLGQFLGLLPSFLGIPHSLKVLCSFLIFFITPPLPAFAGLNTYSFLLAGCSSLAW